MSTMSDLCYMVIYRIPQNQVQYLGYISGIDYIYNLDCEYTRLSFIRSALVTDST